MLQFDGTSATGSASALTANNLSHRYLWGPAVDQILADEQLSPLPPGEGQGEGYDLSTPGTVVWPLTDNEGTVRDLATYNGTTTTIATHRVFDAYKTDAVALRKTWSSACPPAPGGRLDA